jgi:hypothetical protein
MLDSTKHNSLARSYFNFVPRKKVLKKQDENKLATFKRIQIYFYPQKQDTKGIK